MRLRKKRAEEQVPPGASIKVEPSDGPAFYDPSPFQLGEAVRAIADGRLEFIIVTRLSDSSGMTFMQTCLEADGSGSFDVERQDGSHGLHYYLRHQSEEQTCDEMGYWIGGLDDKLAELPWEAEDLSVVHAAKPLPANAAAPTEGTTSWKGYVAFPAVQLDDPAALPGVQVGKRSVLSGLGGEDLVGGHLEVLPSGLLWRAGSALTPFGHADGGFELGWGDLHAVKVQRAPMSPIGGYITIELVDSATRLDGQFPSSLDKLRRAVRHASGRDWPEPRHPGYP